MYDVNAMFPKVINWCLHFPNLKYCYLHTLEPSRWYPQVFAKAGNNSVLEWRQSSNVDQSGFSVYLTAASRAYLVHFKDIMKQFAVQGIIQLSEGQDG